MSVRSSYKSCLPYMLDELEVLEFPLGSKLQSLWLSLPLFGPDSSFA